MLAEEGALTGRVAIYDVTHRADTVSRASDMLVHDRVDELTQIFVEKSSELPDVGDAAARRRYGLPPVSHFSGYGNHGDSATP